MSEKMEKKKTDELIAKTLESYKGKRVTRLEYMMDFGEICIQFNFCLN